MSKELNGKVALVTGGSRGIGAAIAKALADDGADVAISYAASADKADAVVKELRKKGVRAEAFRADQANTKEVEGLVETVVKRFGRLDILVNNAGVYLTSSVLDMNEADWDATIDIDLKGVFLCSRAAVRHMITQRGGRIINITSIAQVRGGTPGHAHYGAAKAGVGAFAKTLAREVGPFGITVNCVAPGLIEDTEMGRVSRELMGDSYLATIPLGCLGRVQDVVDAVLFLASERARYVTGETLNVNGGSYML